MPILIVNTASESSQEDVAKLWGMMIPWLAQRATEYLVACEPERSGSSSVIARLRSQASSTEERARWQASSGLLSRLWGKIAARRPAVDTVCRGTPDPAFVDILLASRLPDESVPCDVVAFREIKLLRAHEALFECYDYGAFQVLHLNEGEAGELRKKLEGAGLPADLLAERSEIAAGSRWFFAGRAD